MKPLFLGIAYTVFAMFVGAGAAVAVFVATVDKLDGSLPIIFSILAGVGAWGALEVAYIKD